MDRVRAPDRPLATVGTLLKGTVVRNLTRLIAIWWAVLKEYRVLPRRGEGKADTPARFTAWLVALGPTFIKLGRILSQGPNGGGARPLSRALPRERPHACSTPASGIAVAGKKPGGAHQ